MQDRETAELTQEPAPEEEPKSQELEQDGADGAAGQAETDGDAGDTPETEPVLDDVTRYKRIARANEKKARRTARELREAQQRLQAIEQGAAKPSKAVDTPRPEEFDDREDYLVARAKHELRQEQAQTERKSNEDKAQAELRELVTSFEGHLDDIADEFEDFDEVIQHASSQDVRITDEMAQAMMEAGESGARIMYQLGKDPDEALRISKLSPLGQARAIGRLEAKLSQPASKPAKRQSKAPPPVAPIKGSGDTVTKDASRMTPDEYRASRGEDPIKPYL